MKPQDIFETVLAQVREYQALDDPIAHERRRTSRTNGRIITKIERVKAVSSRGHITAVRPDAVVNDGPPRVGNFRAEYIADFKLAGDRALVQYPDRLRAFVLYYVDNKKRADVINELRVRPGTFDYWCDHIKKAVGEALRTTDLFPPRLYRRRTDVLDMIAEDTGTRRH